MRAPHWPPAIFVLLLILTSFAAIPRGGGYATVQASYPEQGLTYTVYPNRTVAVDTRASYTRCCFTPNSQITHSIGIGENSNGTVESDSPSPLILTIGRNSSVSWYVMGNYNPSNGTYTPPQYNHTVTVQGPENFNLTVFYYYRFYNNTSPFPIHQFHKSGTYSFQTIAITNKAHRSSPVGHIYVIPAEEYEQPTGNIVITANRQGSTAAIKAQNSIMLTPFELASGYGFPFNDTDSLTLSGSYAKGQSSGILVLHLLSGVQSGLSDLILPFVSNRTTTILNGHATVTFNPALTGTPVQNRTNFEHFFAKTFANASWVRNLQQQVSAYSRGQIQLSSFIVPTPAYSDDTSAVISFNIVFSGDVLKYYLTGGYSSPTSDELYNANIALVSSADFVATYTRDSRTITIQVNGVSTSNFDAQINQIKFIYLNASRPYTQSTQWGFEVSTGIQLQSISLQETISTSAITEEVSASLLAPPTVVNGDLFRMPRLFNFTGNTYFPVNFTLLGGADATHVVNLQIPKGVPAPSLKTPTMAEWLNFKNFTDLEPIVFHSISAHSTLTPLAVALEAFAIILMTFVIARTRMKVIPTQERRTLRRTQETS